MRELNIHNIAIYTPTKEEAQEVTSILTSKGFRIKRIGEWNLHKENTAFIVDYGWIECHHVEYYKNTKSHVIVTLEQFKELNDLWDKKNREDIEIRKPIVIHGWVARDSEQASNTLHFHRNQVKRGTFYWENIDSNKPIGESLILPIDSFPHVKWEDEPIEVELTIKPI